MSGSLSGCGAVLAFGLLLGACCHYGKIGVYGQVVDERRLPIAGAYIKVKCDHAHGYGTSEASGAFFVGGYARPLCHGWFNPRTCRATVISRGRRTLELALKDHCSLKKFAESECRPLTLQPCRPSDPCDDGRCVEASCPSCVGDLCPAVKEMAWNGSRCLRCAPRWAPPEARPRTAAVPTTEPPSLCGPGEETFFTCETSRKRLVSLCGATRRGTGPGEGHLQFRLGHPGQLELASPRALGIQGFRLIRHVQPWTERNLDQWAVLFEHKGTRYTLFSERCSGANCRCPPGHGEECETSGTYIVPAPEESHQICIGPVTAHLERLHRMRLLPVEGR